MSNPSLVVLVFGDNQISLRRHWGGDPEIVGRQVLDQLQSARAIKPRGHFHTGSWLLRLLMADGDEGGQTLPTYEVECLPDNMSGDWEHLYIFKALPDPVAEDGMFTDVGNRWTIGYVDDPDGGLYAEVVRLARWFTEDEFGSFVDAEMDKGLKSGKRYDFQIRDAYLDRLRRSRR